MAMQIIDYLLFLAMTTIVITTIAHFSNQQKKDDYYE
jgi:hypothetical protein